MIASAWVVFTVTAYSWGCGASGKTAYTHEEPIPFFTVAVDRRVVRGGSLIEMDAPFLRGRVYYAEDTGDRRFGGMIEGRDIDLMVATCQQARWWGVRRVPVRIVGHVPRTANQRRPNGLGK